MARILRRLIAGSVLLVFLTRSATAQSRQFGFFNGSSSVTLPNSVWDLRRGWTQLSFRTCNNSGEIIRQESDTGDILRLSLHNGSLEFQWEVGENNASIVIGSNLNNNTWYTCNLRYYLGSIILSVSEIRTTLFSETVANSTQFSYLLDVRLPESDCVIGVGFTGCLFSGVGVNFSRSDIQSSGVLWDSCPLIDQNGCLPGDEDINDCWNNPCVTGECIDGYKSFTCKCPYNFNGTRCENDLSDLGCSFETICQNNGTCQSVTEQGSNYRCLCMPGYTGINCGTEIDECSQQGSSVCHQGRCIDLVAAYRCDCNGTGHTGVTCQDDINECLTDPHPCGIGNCVNNIGTFTCQCPVGYEGIGCLEDVDECLSNPCQNSGRCSPGVNNYTCECEQGYTGGNCEHNIDDCVDVTCDGSNTKCIDGVNNYTCICEEGFTGQAPVCWEIDECAMNPCFAGSTCHDEVNGYSCECPSGFNGTRCEINIDECDSEPCQNGGSCVDGINNYTCHCVPGFRGGNCGENILECVEQNVVCENGATCQDRINDYHCECDVGWEGKHCEVDSDDCRDMPCRNGGQCHDYINYYNCTCATGFTGFNCTENIDDCDPNPCLNGGRCIDGDNDYNCSCTLDWMGKNCTVQYNACVDLNPCVNGGNCYTASPSHVYNCTCPSGYIGMNCEINIDNCFPNPCPGYQRCHDGIESYSCACPVGRTGQLCETDINYCESSPCEHAGTCSSNDITGYTCDCHRTLVNLTKYTNGTPNEFWSGWEGQNCETDIDECNATVPACLSGGICQNRNGSYTCFCGPQQGSFTTGYNCESTSSYCRQEELEKGGPPCKNGGTCQDIQAERRFECLCALGYTGDRCETDIDECESGPCQHNGTCYDDINDYNCTCAPGYAGKDCEINIDDCSPYDPCWNYGLCIDGINAYECNCAGTGFTGTHCQNNIDDCVGHRCTNGAPCVDGIKKYGCACYRGYTGQYCETDIDECVSSPCQYSGTCIQRSNQTLYGDSKFPDLDNFSYSTAAGYICQCIPGITGANCEVNIDDCVNHPCENGASCVDKINAFECDCAPGYKGNFCQEEIDECQLYRACQNGATCEDKIADYLCQCPPFQKDSTNYGGKNCTVELTGCNGNVLCENGATCIPYLVDETSNRHDYTCQCPEGYTGRYCQQSTEISFTDGARIIKNGVRDFQLDFRFKTTLKSAMLVMYRPSEGQYISVEIKDENLYAVFGDNIPVFNQMVLTRSGISDAETHSVTMIIKQNITLKLESSLCNSREECTVSHSFPRALIYNQPTLYIGSVNQSTIATSLSRLPFTGCMDDVIYNSNDYLMLTEPNNAQYEGVQFMCNRTEQCLPYTCKRHGDCIDLWNTFRCECYRPYLGPICADEYKPATFYKDNARSWASFNLASIQTELQNTVDLSLFITTRQKDGVIMYFGSDNPNLTFFALEMRNGKLSLQFSVCQTRDFILSSNDYNDGNAHFIRVQMSAGNLTFSVNQGLSGLEQFIDTKTVTQTACVFTPQVAYFGGRVPETRVGRRRRRRQTDPVVSVGDFSNSSYFQGIIQDVEVNDVKLQFYPVQSSQGQSLNMTSSTNLTEGSTSTENACDLSPCQQNGTCTDTFYNDFSCDCPYGYRGKDCSELDFCRNATCPSQSQCQSLHNGYECVSQATYDGSLSLANYRATLNPGTRITTMSFKLRTGVLFGAILNIQHGGYFMKMRVADGEIQLNYKLKDEISSTLSVAHHVNDGQLYEVHLSMLDNTITIQVLRNGTISGENDVTVNGILTNLTQLLQNNNPGISVGGIGQSGREQSYKGCLDEVRIGDLLLPNFDDSVFQNNDMRTEYFSLVRENKVDTGCTFVMPNANLGNMGRNGATCYLGWNGETNCICPLGFSGKFCEVNNNDCSSSPCFNRGVCVDGVNTFTCKCRKGYQGDRCQDDVNFCNATVCGNNGSCREDQSGFICDCNEDFTGVTCDVVVNQPCLTGLCQNGGVCQDINRTLTSGIVNSFNCTCVAGYEGPVCEKAIDYCANLPCGANGNCTSLPDSQDYTCSCEPGFTGKPCRNIDDCSPGVCLNGGTCQDLVNNYTCDCTPGWTGKQCTQDVNECETNPCLHGNCTNQPGSYTCHCFTGYKSDHCDEQINECDEIQPCRNNATCSDTEGSYVCNCTLGYEGQNCDVPDCTAGQCLNGASCKTEAEKWICECAQYYDGVQCEIEGPCLNQTCDLTNTAECIQDIDYMNYTCSCSQGWEGENCLVDIDECVLGTDGCENGATCVNNDGGYTCSCVDGYTGQYCETDIDDCATPGLCVNGVCRDLVNNYTCDCANTGYEGADCSIDINECTTQQPCTGNTNCVNTDGGYNCQCRQGFIGSGCVKDPCTETICEHEGICNASAIGGGDYEALCICTDGYEGNFCEKAEATTQSSDLDIWIIIGPVIAVVLLIVIIGIVVFVMMARTKRATRGTYSPSRQETSGARVELGNVLKKPPEERLI